MIVIDFIFLYVFEVIQDNFEVDVLQVLLNMFVLVDFWVIWCELCKMLGLLFEQFVVEYNGVFWFGKVDVDVYQQFVVMFGICLIFIVMLVKDGQIFDGFVGVLLLGQLCEFLLCYVQLLEGVFVVEEVVVEVVELFEDVVNCLQQVIVVELNQDELKFDLVLVLMWVGNVVGVQVEFDVLLVKFVIDVCVVCLCSQFDLVCVFDGVFDLFILCQCVVVDLVDWVVCDQFGVWLLLENDVVVGLDQFFVILEKVCDWNDGVVKKCLFVVFVMLDDVELVGCYCWCMVLLLF